MDLLNLWLKVITFMVSITFMVNFCITFMVGITFMGDTNESRISISISLRAIRHIRL